ncbi:hypothetical protein DFH11DRAFT_990194 [Phellopilus nigrolimitatus]|nr:hypothetical protein DFH11DRAFT_990194 [Phellopilus nigrolimitatus]
MGGSADSSAWFQPLSHMDEDGHLHNHPDPLEVDMMVYDYDETEEYEMGNESYVTAPEVDTETFTQTYAAPDDNVLDAEVYDLSVHSSPLPPPALELDERYIADTVPADGLHVPAEMPQSDDAATAQNFTNPHVVHVSEIPLDASAVHQHEYLDSHEGIGHGHENDEPEHLGGLTSNAVRMSREESANIRKMVTSIVTIKTTFLKRRLLPGTILLLSLNIITRQSRCISILLLQFLSLSKSLQMRAISQSLRCSARQSLLLHPSMGLQQKSRYSCCSIMLRFSMNQFLLSLRHFVKKNIFHTWKSCLMQRWPSMHLIYNW